MKDTNDFLNCDIYPSIQSQSNTAFPEFGFKRISNGWEATQGEINGAKAKGHLYHYDNSPFCFKNHKTGEVITLWDYIQGNNRLTNQETLKELARLANYTLPDLKGYSEEKAKEQRERVMLLETALDYFKNQLWTAQGKEAVDYLKDKRGYTEGEIKTMELGFYPSQEEVEAHLVNKSYSVNIVNTSGLKTRGFGETHKLVIPYRDPIGRLKGFIVRAIKGEIEYKYLYSSGTKKDTLFNLNETRGEKTLTVTEGYLDALIATQRGIKGVVAVGGSSLTETQLENALKYKVKDFILALDNDEAGRKGTERSIELINAKGLRCYVTALPEGKDPDDLIREKGVEAFKKAIKEAESGARWTAERILEKNDIGTESGEGKALDQVLSFMETLDPYDQEKVRAEIRTRLDIPGTVFDDIEREFKEQRAKERSEKKGIELYGLKELERDITQTPEGLKTGYESIDNLIRIPQGAITIVAGRPSHGKTTLLMNLLINMVKIYQDKRFFFFSYEESRRQVGLKLLNILSGKVISREQNVRQLQGYIKAKSKTHKEIEEGKKKFTEFTESGRLWIIDQNFYIDDLVNTIAYLSKIHDNIGAIFIDYIQKVKIGGRFNTRQIEIQKISEKLLETAKNLSLPIILGAQVGRVVEGFSKLSLDTMREAGDIEQDANLVIGLYNEAMDRAEDKREQSRQDIVDLNLVILKNRNGIVNQEFVLKFNRPVLRIEETKTEKL